jgi:phosphoglycerate dehydrogenase-like enzyme
MLRVAVIDDWQGVAHRCAEWTALEGKTQVQFFAKPFTDEDTAAQVLSEFNIIVPMRERTRFSKSLLQRLPNLRLLALTGSGTRHVDMEYCNQHGILCCGSGSSHSPTAPAELTLGLMLAAARHIAAADAAIRAGEFQEHIGFGTVLEGKTLGLIGLGRIGARVAAYGRALGMQVIAWSQHLTDEYAHSAGAKLVTKDALLQHADVVSLHLIYSARSHHTLGATELALMKQGAILVNTSRGPLIDEAALLVSLLAGRITAALDVYNEEPLPADHPLRTLDNTVLTPHLGFVTQPRFVEFYGQSIENILGYINHAPLRVLNPEVTRNN